MIKFDIESEVVIDQVKSFLVGSDGITYETYNGVLENNQFTINRFLNSNIPYGQNYNLRFVLDAENNQYTRTIPVNINASVIVDSFCASENCQVLSSNVVEGIKNKLTIGFYNILPVKIKYVVTTPDDNFQILHEFNSPVQEDWVENLMFNKVKEEYSSYISKIEIFAYDADNNEAKTEQHLSLVQEKHTELNII